MATNNESTPARRIDDHRPAVGLDWTESGVQQARAPFDRPDQWTILLTSSNHGLVGAYGHNFPHATGDFVRVNVCDETIVTGLRQRMRELEANRPCNVRPSHPGADVAAEEARLYRDLTCDALALGFDSVPAALAALRSSPASPEQAAQVQTSMRTELDGWNAAAKALAERAVGHYRNNDFRLQDECLQCASMLHDMKPGRATFEGEKK
jgi:hypothetical protein